MTDQSVEKLTADQIAAMSEIELLVALAARLDKEEAVACLDSVDAALDLLARYYYILTRDKSSGGQTVCYVWGYDHPFCTPLFEGRGPGAVSAICRAWLVAQAHEAAPGEAER